jgi:trehalose 6-phosphate phosphatase
MRAVTHDALPPFHDAALLIDFDGTLIDIAPTPDSVVIPTDLPATLRTVRRQLGDALAVVTGRTIDTIDALLGDAPHAVAGEHGGAIRPDPGAPTERPDLSPPPPGWIAHATMLEAAHPGSLFEPKPRGFALHYRLAPDAGPALGAALAALVSGSAAFGLLHGHMTWEVRPNGVDKGDAVAILMRRPPFLGRVPVFIGDDVTDEDGMRVARAMGGAGLRVQNVFGDAAGVRTWLRETAASGDWGALR